MPAVTAFWKEKLAIGSSSATKHWRVFAQVRDPKEKSANYEGF